jgi:sphinganine-1-phosphate aldolase
MSTPTNVRPLNPRVVSSDESDAQQVSATELASLTAIPRVAIDHAQLLESMRGMRADDLDWKHAKTWSLVYYAGDAHHELLRNAHDLFLAENALNPMAFKSLKRMEAEVVRMTATLLNGDDETCGTMTSGGTESLLLAVKAARDRAKKKKPWIVRPNIVIPESAHAAFRKACHYFGLNLREAPLGKDFRVDTRAMMKLVDRNTVLMAASAPQYPHGVIDDIPTLASFAKKKGIPFHVDACVGGFILPFIEKLGHSVRPWDFRVDGVTSISADLHKYGYAAKGASVVVYRDMSYLTHQFYLHTSWSGGIYASPGIPGTRPGGPIAAAWAALTGMGEEGYKGHTAKALEAKRKLVAGIRAIGGLRVIGSDDATLVTWGSDDASIDVYAVCDQLEAKGWATDRQQHPASVHLTVTSNHLPIVDDYLRDLAEAVRVVKSDPTLKASGNAAMYGMMAKIPFPFMVGQGVRKVMEAMYGPRAAEPNLTQISSSDPDPLMRIMETYREPIMKTLEVVEKARARVSRRRAR